MRGGHFLKMKKFWKWLNEDFEETLLMILLIAMSVAMVAQIVMRYVFSASMSWPEEFCRFTFVVSGFLSIGYCVRKNKMLKVDILLGFFPEGMKKAVDLIGRVFTLVFFGYLGYHGWFALVNSFTRGMKSPAMEMPMWILYAFVVFGCLLGVIRQIQDLYGWFTQKKEVKEAE